MGKMVLILLTFCLTVVAAENIAKTVSIPGNPPADVRFVLIRPGSFTLGSNSPDAPPDCRPARKVTIKKPFYFGVYEVTQKQWAAVMGSQDKAKGFSSGPSAYYGPSGETPVENISLDNTTRFIVELNKLGIGRFRLPTEAEWEYACRAGRASRYFWGDDPSTAAEYAWFRADTSHPRKVGQKKPNAWGLYDMAGNVSEWVHTQYLPYDSKEYQTEKPQQSSNGICRGGSFFHDVGGISSVVRHQSCNSRSPNCGFRLVMDVEIDREALKKAELNQDVAALKRLADESWGLPGCMMEISNKIIQLLCRQKKTEDAVGYLFEVQKNVVDKNDEYYYFIMHANQTLTKSGKSKEMIPFFEKEVAGEMKVHRIFSLILYSMLGDAYMSAGDQTKALESYRKGAEFAVPGHNNTYFLLMAKAKCELAGGKKEAAAATCRQIIQDTAFSKNRRDKASVLLETIGK